jgi:hypothetical protein
LFNVTFISFIQSVLLFALAAPTYGIMLASQRETEATLADFAFTAVQLGLVTVEWFSDQQQWSELFFHLFRITDFPFSETDHTSQRINTPRSDIKRLLKSRPVSLGTSWIEGS